MCKDFHNPLIVRSGRIKSLEQIFSGVFTMYIYTPLSSAGSWIRSRRTSDGQSGFKISRRALDSNSGSNSTTSFTFSLRVEFCATTCVAQCGLGPAAKGRLKWNKNERACIGDLSCISLILSGYRAITFTGFPSFVFTCTYLHTSLRAVTSWIIGIRIYSYRAHG